MGDSVDQHRDRPARARILMSPGDVAGSVRAHAAPPHEKQWRYRQESQQCRIF
jgi:hypothetical protein